MTKQRRVPVVLWRLFQNRARTLAETLLSFVPSIQCRCEDSRRCLRCCCDGDRMSFLLTENDPSDYRKLLNHCFVVVSDNAPSPPPFHPHSRWPQLEIVRRTIEMLLWEQGSTKNVICAGYSKHNRSSGVIEALTSASWSLLLQRVGDSLMVYLLKYSSIFIPLPRKKHLQVAGIPINGLCWKVSKNPSKSKNQQPSLGFAEKYYDVDSISKNVDSPESSMSCLGCNVKGSVNPCKVIRKRKRSKTSCHRDSMEVFDANLSGTTQENTGLAVAQSGKRLRPYAWQRRCIRRKLTSQNMYDANRCLPKEEIEVKCSCCSVLRTVQKVPREVQISRQSMLYNLERASSILPGKHIINSLRPNVAGANALFKEIFGADPCIAAQPTLCSHRNDICVVGRTCLYHSLHKLLKILIRKAMHCPRLRLLKKHMATPSKDQSANEDVSSRFEHFSLSDRQGLYCSKRQVVSFIWAACRNIVPRELLGSPYNQRILRKNISMFIRLRIYEKFSVHQCMRKLKTSGFPFISQKHTLCHKVQRSSRGDNEDMDKDSTSITKRNLLDGWIYWFFTCLVVPLVRANFYLTESEHGNLEVFFYQKPIWEELMKKSISCLQEQCYRLLNTNAVNKIVSTRAFGFSRVRFRPKANGIRPLANLASRSRLRLKQSSLQAKKRRLLKHKDFKAVNVVLRDLHVALKDVQLKRPEKLGSSVFSYNDVHKKFCCFLSRVKGRLSKLPCVYMVVADVRKAYDSINQDKLLHVMKDVITGNHLLHETHQVVASKRNQVYPCSNLSGQPLSHAHASSSHSILIDQGKRTTLKKEDLHFNLEQHVKHNVLYVDKRFFLQNVGISQGSIVSSLMCSFYYGHMENSILVPFLNKIAKRGLSECPMATECNEDLLLRFIDDFLYISTSKKQALAFLSRLERGFNEYNCNMNVEKFGASFDVDKIKPQSNRLHVDEDGNKFLRWSGLFINCKTLEVQADYTRYLETHLRSTLTICWQGSPRQHFRQKVCNYLRPKCHAIFYDSNINSASIVRLNIHQAFLLCAMKFHCYVCELSDICSFDPESYMDIIHNSLRFMYRLMKKRMYCVEVEPSLRPILKVKREEVEWLGLSAYIQVLKPKQSKYKELLPLLHLKLKSHNVGRVSPALNFAIHKSKSSLLWKIKY